MKKPSLRLCCITLGLLLLAVFAFSTVAQEVSIPHPGLNALIRQRLGKPVGPLTQQDMLTLTNLGAISSDVRDLRGLEAARNLQTLFLEDAKLTSVSIPPELTQLTDLDLNENPLTSLSLPPGLSNLTTLHAEFCSLTNIDLPPGLTGLSDLRLGFNQLPQLNLHADMTNLHILSVYLNQLTNLNVPPSLTSLIQINADGNQLSQFTLPASLSKLVTLILGNNLLTHFSLPSGLTNLEALRLFGNQLTNFSLPEGMSGLSLLNLQSNRLSSLTLPPEVSRLTVLLMDGRSLESLILSEPLAASSLATTVAVLRDQGIPVYTYPLDPRLVQPAVLAGAFKLGIVGPPGIYSVVGSTNLADWSAVGVATSPLGSVLFHDPNTNPPPGKFYRALLVPPPADMVFIPATRFTMGTAASELHRRPDEGPQTSVTLSRNFWMGKHEVTQGEYLAVVGSNPSGFPGDLDRPVESVSWLDATNYCALLTRQKLAAGSILPGFHYRLPTEAEWECAARAGTTTRFSYGDDPDYVELRDHAWYWFNSGVGTHPVGQKAPNPWGLYDMEGNVWEWTLDWHGPYPGEPVTDPRGVAANVQGVKVIRGGAWDAFESDCRSGRRLTEGVHPLIKDSIIGFRVVLVTEPD